jgi:Zn-dependent protease
LFPQTVSFSGLSGHSPCLVGIFMESAVASLLPPTLPPPLPLTKETCRENPAVVVCGLDSTRLTWGEWWRTSPGLVAVIGWCSKLLRTRILDSLRLLIVRDAGAFEIGMDALGDDPRRKVLPQVEALRRLGFGEPRVMRVTSVFTNRDVVLVAQLHESGRTLSRIVYSYPLSGATTNKKIFSIGFLTRFGDGRMLCTDNKRPKHLSPRHIFAKWKGGGLVRQFAAHNEHIGQVSDTSVSLLTSENVWHACDNYEIGLAAFHESRGLYVPLTSAQGANIGTIACPDQARHAATLAELARLQTAKPRSLAGVILLVLSFLVFAGTGALRWSWQTAVIIAAALFFHELGHYIAMRWFNYRDLRMFFIPLFGAAVTGRNHNVAGWKKAIILLMGPVPGIALGTALGIWSVFIHQPALGHAALLVIILNLFNLLPVFPLDGGAFWNAVLFCRHPWLETGFKSLAGLALMIGALISGMWVFLYVGFVMVKGAPKTLRLGAVAARLRQKGWEPGSDDTVSPEAAETILAELKEPGKNSPAARTAASDALNVFEHLNARPPGLFGSFGLAATYGAAIVLGFIGLGASLSAENKASSRISASAHDTALERTPFLPANFRGELLRFPDSSALEQSVPQRRIITTFPDADSASAAFARVQLEETAIDRLLQFGQSIIAVTRLDNNNGARQLGERFRQDGATVIDTGHPLTACQFDLQFSAPSEEAATRMRREFETYFALQPDLRPVAPWVRDDTITPEAREQFMKAATTYVRVLDAQSGWLVDPEMERLMRSRSFWPFGSRKAALERGREMRMEREEFARNAVQKLQASGDSTLDPRVLSLALREPRGIDGRRGLDAYEKWQREMRELLTGCGDRPREATGDRYLSGTVTISGNQITLHSMSAAFPEQILPNFARYLAGSHCNDIHYGFYNAEAFEAARLTALR